MEYTKLEKEYYKARYPDGTIIALATSSWLIIDRDTKRIQRPDSLRGTLNSDKSVEKALPGNAIKLEPASGTGRSVTDFRIKVSDLDINLHTNNSRYLKWITDSYDLDFMLNNVPLSAEINYLAESRFGDTIAILISEDEGGHNIFNHSIMRTSDNTELCRVRIRWGEKGI